MSAEVDERDRIRDLMSREPGVILEGKTDYGDRATFSYIASGGRFSVAVVSGGMTREQLWAPAGDSGKRAEPAKPAQQPSRTSAQQDSPPSKPAEKTSDKPAEKHDGTSERWMPSSGKDDSASRKPDEARSSTQPSPPAKAVDKDANKDKPASSAASSDAKPARKPAAPQGK